MKGTLHSYPTPASKLDSYFDPTQPRVTFSDSEIDDIAGLLQKCETQRERTSHKCPRTYIVLRAAGHLEVIEQMLTDGFDDHRFPVSAPVLPSFLDPRIKAAILQHQPLIFTKGLDLENGKHGHFTSNESLPFDVLSRLGAGKYGQVDVILSKISYKHYALKRIRRKVAFGNKSREIITEFLDEMKIVKKINHIHIIKYIGSYTDEAHLALIMHPVADCDLQKYLQNACTAPETHATLRTFFGCLAAALSHLHDNSVKHRDIKPQNILVLRSNVFITDFGLSREFLDTTSGPTAHTPRYCPPEVASHEGRNMSADIWSLGCVFIEMVAALKGYDVSWLRKYYTNIHSNSPSFHANPKATEQLLKEWSTSTEDLDSTPLGWIQGMLSDDRHKRPTAASVVDMIMSPDSSGNTMNFCGTCCATDTTRYSVCSLLEGFLDIYGTNEETTDFSSERLMASAKSGSSGDSDDTESTEAVGQSSGAEPDIRSLLVSTNSHHSEHTTQQPNLNPLSATESIVGILTTAAKLHEIIRTITSTGNAPNSLHLLPRELQEIEGVLLSLQIIFADLSSVSPNRTAMIQLDELIATLTDAVLAIDKLRHTVTTLAANIGSAMSNQAELTQAETSCMDHLERIQGLRRSLALILSVLRCVSDPEASRLQTRLSSRIEQLLQNNHELCQRMRSLEDKFDATSIITRKLGYKDDGDTIRTAGPHVNKRMSILDAVRIRFAFEDDLYSSRVYRMARDSVCDKSFVSSAFRSNAWSVFSGLSLADISIISVVALPLHVGDVTFHECYSFGKVDTPKQWEPSADWDLWLRSQSIGESKNEANREQSPHIAPSSMHVPQVVSEQHNHPGPTIRTAGAEVIREEQTSSQEEPASLDDIGGGEEDIIYICRGCGEVMEEGKAFQLDGNRWHIDCFRCKKCTKLLDDKSNTMLKAGKDLLCSDCVPVCARCHDKIEDTAIVTENDEAFCAGCFLCMSCNVKIKDLRYARTSKGMICIQCYEVRMARRRAREQRQTECVQRPLSD